MARHEQDREDILREATALVERTEIRLTGHVEPVVIGFRRDGSAAFFFGTERVFQFNSLKQLRRGYYEGRLLKAEGGRLVALRRDRGPSEVVLRRHDLSDEETARMLAEVRQHLDQLAEHIQHESYTTTGQVPRGADIMGRIRSWLKSLVGGIEIAQRPHVGTS